MVVQRNSGIRLAADHQREAKARGVPLAGAGA